MRTLIGHSIGRYHILEQLGEGGMAVVYKAFDTHPEIEVAVKVIRLDNIPPKMHEHALKRFAREGKVLVQLDHTNIVRVTDVGEHEGVPWLVMPLLSGGTLKHRMKTHGRYEWHEALQLLMPIADALSYSHNKKVIHRDVKPSNILFSYDGTLKISDFGIAKVLETEITVELTGTAAAIGTPEYMAPEQIVGKHIDARADIYALGVVLYELITGRRPFEATTPMAVLIKHTRDPLPRPSKYVKNLPEAVEYLLIKALAKRPQDRFESMADFLQAMQIVLQHPERGQFPKQIELAEAYEDLRTVGEDLTIDPYNTSIEEQTAPPLPPISVVYPPPIPEKKKGVGVIGYILGVVFALIGIVLAIILFSSGTRKANPAGINPSVIAKESPSPNVDTIIEKTKTPTPEEVNTPIWSTPKAYFLNQYDLHSYINPGDLIRVALGGGKNGIRSEADTTPSNNRIGIAESGEVMLVVSGPERDRGGYLLWQVIPTYDTDWEIGWTPEIAEPIGEYWLEPLPTWNPCANSGLKSHLETGGKAFVSVITDTSNKVRETPSLDGDDIGRIKAGESMNI